MRYDWHDCAFVPKLKPKLRNYFFSLFFKLTGLYYFNCISLSCLILSAVIDNGELPNSDFLAHLVEHSYWSPLIELQIFHPLICLWLAFEVKLFWLVDLISMSDFDSISSIWKRFVNFFGWEPIHTNNRNRRFHILFLSDQYNRMQ